MPNKLLPAILGSFVIVGIIWKLGMHAFFKKKFASILSLIRNKSSFIRQNELQQLKKKFIHEQNLLKKNCILYDVEEWQKQLKCCSIEISKITKADIKTTLKSEGSWKDGLLMNATHLPFVIGSDISFIKGNEEDACVAIVVMKLPDLEVVYEDISFIKLAVPYIPGFLAFREALPIVEKVEKLKKIHPEFNPSAIMLDGNGTLHHNEFGLACHVGVLLDMVSLGVAKSPYFANGLLDHDIKSKLLTLESAGNRLPLVSNAGRVLGMAVKSTGCSSKPVFVSPGHKISLETSVALVELCCKFRVPEPIRQADIRSRQYIRDHFPT